MRGQDKQSRERTPGGPSPKPRRDGGRAAPGRPSAGLLALQRAAGNAAVSRAVAEERHRHDADCGHLPAATSSPSVQRSAVHQVLRTTGRPLDAPLRMEKEARLGADFGDVRLHTDAADEHTLAHELTHVIRQRDGRGRRPGQRRRAEGRRPRGPLRAGGRGERRRVMSGAAPVRSAPPGAADGVRRAGDAEASQVQRAPATATEEAAAPVSGFRQTRETGADDRDVTLRMLDRMARIALNTIRDTNDGFRTKKPTGSGSSPGTGSSSGPRSTVPTPGSTAGPGACSPSRRPCASRSGGTWTVRSRRRRRPGTVR